MKFIARLITFILLISPFTGFSQQTITFPEAKFKTGDNPAWKMPDFDDAKWPLIATTTRWEEQGYKKYNGYAWYRIHLKLPMALKKQAYWKDTLSVLLSKIDDIDESFFNGVKIGQTGLLPTDAGGPLGKWDTYRIYNIPADSKFINWDGDNVIAVRVFDTSNGGGIFGPIPSVKMKEPQDEVVLTIVADHLAGTTYQAFIKNNSKKTIEGKWSVSVKEGAQGHIIKTLVKNVSLRPLGEIKENVHVSGTNRLEVTSLFKEIHTGKVQSIAKVTPYILTPVPAAKPRINSPAVFGVRQGSPFLFKVAATGKGQLHYQAAGLPAGLTLNSTTGIITGSVSTKGDFNVQFKVSNKLGKATQLFTLKVGDKLALTPPMGWNSWNCWGLAVNTQKVKASATAFINKGLIDHGWNYINIDDGWEKPERDKDGNVLANDKFKDMGQLGSWLHDKGLKFGIYSSPGPATCGGYLGSYQHELKDATTYANWGIDYLKYDWCSYEEILDHDTLLSAYQKPYQIMSQALQAQPRDVIYSLCQYGMKAVWEWGDQVNGNSWRTTGDIKDTWESVQHIGFGHPERYRYVKPGNWNDPDMLVIGQVGGWSGKLHNTLLTPDEQYTHISLWCLLSAPLLIGCDLSSLDNFTLNLITNDEVLAVDQDILGKQAQQKIKTEKYQVWVKQLNDGGHAVGVFNMSDCYQQIPVNFKAIGLNNSNKVRDLWRQKDMGGFENNFTTWVPPHGVSLIKLTNNKH